MDFFTLSKLRVNEYLKSHLTSEYFSHSFRSAYRLSYLKILFKKKKAIVACCTSGVIVLLQFIFLYMDYEVPQGMHL